MNHLLFNGDKTIWLALIVSLLLHGLLFVFSGKTFIQHAQYSVQPSVQAVEVSIEEIKDPSVSKGPISSLLQGRGTASEAISKRTANFVKIATQPAVARNDTRLKADPNYFQNPAPEYPELAKQMQQEGLVILAVDVDEQGLPVKVGIQQSSGYRSLDRAAIKAVSHWKFQPGRMGGIPVESAVTVPIRFRLEK